MEINWQCHLTGLSIVVLCLHDLKEPPRLRSLLPHLLLVYYRRGLLLHPTTSIIAIQYRIHLRFNLGDSKCQQPLQPREAIWHLDQYLPGACTILTHKKKSYIIEIDSIKSSSWMAYFQRNGILKYYKAQYGNLSSKRLARLLFAIHVLWNYTHSSWELIKQPRLKLCIGQIICSVYQH